MNNTQWQQIMLQAMSHVAPQNSKQQWHCNKHWQKILHAKSVSNKTAPSKGNQQQQQATKHSNSGVAV